MKEVCIPLPTDEISDMRTIEEVTAPQEQVIVDGSQVEIESPLATEVVNQADHSLHLNMMAHH